MLATALSRTWRQMLHPRFRGVFLCGFAAAGGTLAALTYLIFNHWPAEYTSGWDWLDNSGLTMITLLSWYLFFPAISTIVMGLLADKVSDAVEDEYYPNRRATRQVSQYEIVFGSLKLMLFVILVNIIALIPYIILFATTGDIGTLALFIIVNGLLLGREYFEMVVIRHMKMKEVTKLRKHYGNKIFIAGALIAGFFAVPFLNILAPIIAASVMTHVFHHLYEG